MFKQYQVVQTTVPINVPEGVKLPTGSRGTIVDIYDNPRRGYHTEFVNSDGSTRALVVLTTEQIEDWQPARKAVSKVSTVKRSTGTDSTSTNLTKKRR